MKMGAIDISNPLELIKCIMAFDSRDWMSDYRDRMLYAIVFGMDGIEEDYRKIGYSDEKIEEYKTMHDRYKSLSKIKF